MSLYSLVRGDQIIIQPVDLYKYFWIDPLTGKGYSGLLNLSAQSLDELGWKRVVYENIEYNSNFEKVNEGSFYYDPVMNIVTKSQVVEELSFVEALTLNSNILEENREANETSGFLYNKQIMGQSVIILTDKESSQGKLNSGYTMAKEGSRSDTDVWKFHNNQRQTLVLPLTNLELIDVCEFVYRKIQDAYNLTSQTYFQMLGCGTTSILKEQITDGTINLNPWSI